MSCYDCAEKFSFFRKEVGCPNCGYGFCSKCCSQKVAVPKKDNKVLGVCRGCFKKLTDPKAAANSEYDREFQIVFVNYVSIDLWRMNLRLDRARSPPANFLKLVEQNNSKLDPNIRGPSSQGAKASAPDPTKLLEERLNKLKERPDQGKPIPNDEELTSKLRQIQGTNPQIHKLSNLPGKQIVNTPEDLIKQFTEEVEIEKKHGDFEKEEIEKLEQRLRNLSDGTVARKPDDAASNEAATSKVAEPTESGGGGGARAPSASSTKSSDLVKKFLSEAENDYRKQHAADDDDEDVWCCLCNGDAQFRCIDCDNDYYCKRCYKQSHDTYEYKQHRRQQIS